MMNEFLKTANNTIQMFVGNKHIALAIMLFVDSITEAQIIKAEKQTISMLL